MIHLTLDTSGDLASYSWHNRIDTLHTPSESNFGKISEFTADILLRPVSENKRPPCWNFTSGFDFHVCVIMGMSLCTCLPDFVQVDHPWQSYDIISIFQDGGHGNAILLPVSFFGVICEGRNEPADQILARYIDTRLRCYYRFLKTNVRHVGILFTVSIFTLASSWACNSAPAYQISSKSDRARWSYDVIVIFKMAAISHIEFSQG